MKNLGISSLMKNIKKIKFPSKKRLGAYAAAILAAFVLFNLPPSENHLKSRVVKLTNDKVGQCSGEQIRTSSGKDYILTAGHCRGLVKDDGNITVQTEDGKKLERKFIAEDPQSDLLLIEGLPGVRGIDIARYSMQGDHVRTFTHGAGHDTYKSEGELMETKHIEIMVEFRVDEEIKGCDLPKNKKVDAFIFIFQVHACLLSVDETYTTANVVPGSSGGMAVNDNGELTGVVSAGDGHFGAFVQLSDIHNFLNNY